VTASLQNVHVRVNDATGRPTPVRIRFADAHGRYFAPFGRLPEFATGPNEDVGGNVLIGTQPHAYIDGTCEIRLPIGPVTVQAAKGFEYLPLRQALHVRAGQLTLRLALERWADLRHEGWYPGDTRAHCLSPHAALLEAAAEDLAVVHLLAVECAGADGHGRAIPNLLAFSGQRPALESPGHLVVVNTHNTHPVLGSLALLHCHRVVHPLRFGGPDGLDDWTLSDWCDQCHRKAGLVLWTPDPAAENPGEALADLLLGKVDALESTGSETEESPAWRLWYHLLNAGSRVPLAGSSAKTSNRVPLGRTRTYAQLNPGEQLTCKTWVEAVRAGRTFVTNGPLLTLTVNGQGPGAVLEPSGSSHDVRVRAEARSLVPFDRLEVVVNGNVVAGTSAAGSPLAAALEVEPLLSAGGWVAARCRGGGAVAHTSPVYVRVAGNAPAPDAEAVDVLLGHLDRMMRWVSEQGRFETDPQRLRLLAVFDNARRTLLASAGRDG
jgi:hypothetical protein